MTFEAEGMQFEEDELPSQFQDLIPLLSRWCIGDDVQRIETIESASTEELQRLIASVTPKFEAIDSYLRSFGIHPPHTACLLGGLSEATCEAEMILEERAIADMDETDA